MNMLENLAWEIFRLTGNIEEYLLYKNVDSPETVDTGTSLES